MKIMERFGMRGLVLTMSILLMGGGSTLAESGPFENFFHKLRSAFSEPQHKPAHRSSHKQTDETKTSPSEDSNTHPATGGASAPPTERNTRTTTRAASKKGDDLRYATPVPGKKGFVTSPFSPDAGYIDVRGFAPGTPVKDPYTGKVFLTP
jgi:hypothetical protein